MPSPPSASWSSASLKPVAFIASTPLSARSRASTSCLRKLFRSAAGNLAVDLPCARVVGRRVSFTASFSSFFSRLISAALRSAFICCTIDMPNATALAVSTGT